MHKTLSAAIFLCLPLQAFSSTLEVSSLGDPVSFAQPFQAQVTIIERVNGLIYWAEPKRTDVKSVEAVKKFVSESRTTNYMASPFVFQLRLAGVSKEDTDGADLTKDGFSRQTTKSISEALEGNSYIATCYGQYTNTIVPYCDLHDANGSSPVVGLVRAGLLQPDAQMGQPAEAERRALGEALDAAKSEQIGIWKPFHGMFRGLQ